MSSPRSRSPWHRRLVSRVRSPRGSGDAPPDTAPSEHGDSLKEKNLRMKRTRQLCECGCGDPVTKPGNRFINGHYWKGKPGVTCYWQGKAAPNRGVPHSLETRQKISQSHMGRKASPATREKISNSVSVVMREHFRNTKGHCWQDEVTEEEVGSLNCFRRVLIRQKRVGGEYKNTPAEFRRWLSDMGEAPEMKRPSVGRINHNRGYFADNIRWQETVENCGDRTRW